MPCTSLSGWIVLANADYSAASRPDLGEENLFRRRQKKTAVYYNEPLSLRDDLISNVQAMSRKPVQSLFRLAPPQTTGDA